MGDGSVGNVFLDLVVRDTVNKQVENISNKATASARKSFAGFESAIGASVNKAIAKVSKIGEAIANGPANAMDRAAVRISSSSQKAFQSVASAAASCGRQVETNTSKSFNRAVAMAQAKVSQLESALSNVTAKLNTAKATDDDASAKKFGSQQEAIYDRLAAARQKLSIEMQAAAQKESTSQTSAAEKAKSAFTKAFNSIRNLGKRAFSSVGKAVSSIKDKLTSTGKSASYFGSRLKGIVSSALIFNGISAALRKMTQYFGDAVTKSASMQSALANLKGAAATAAAPIIESLTPALVALTNAAATAFSYLSRLISFFTGKSISAMSNAAKKMQATAGAAKKAMASIAGFDEIQKLDSNDSSGGGGTAEVQPNFDFQGQSSFLDSVMESVKAGNWGDVGALLSKKLNSCLNSINWPNIQKKASSWVSGLVEGINGFVQNLDWESVGSTIGESINTLITSVGTFFANMDWTTLGSGIGEGISSIFTSINWEQYKQSLTEGFNSILEMVSGFASGFAPLQGIDFSDATESLQGLWQSVCDFAELVGGTLSKVYTTVLKPIRKWAIEDAAPASVDVFTAAFDALSAILKPVMEGLDGLMAGLEPVIAFIEDVAVIALEGLRDIFEKIGHVFAEKGSKVQEIISGIGDIVVAVWKRIEPIMVTLKETVGGVFSFIGDIVGTAIGLVINVLGDLIDFVAGVFTGNWGRAWDGIVGIFNGLVDTIKGTINSVIGFINGLISGVCSGINTIIKAMNKLKWEIPDWVPAMGGKTFGFNLKTIEAPQIPMLANGGVITQPTLAMMGEYAGAGSNPEIVTPQALMEKTMAGVMQNYTADMVQCFEALLEENRLLRQVVENINIGDTVIGEAVVRYNRRQSIMYGGAF